MRKLAILGVAHISDFYPNVRYKIELIKSLKGICVSTVLYDLGGGALCSNFGKNKFFQKCLSLLSLTWGTLAVFLRFLFHKTDSVYVTYPGLGLMMLLSVLPKKIRPDIYLDAFISIYDTVVNDRSMFVKSSWQARLLFWVERRAFSVADYILVDTLENAEYYSELFLIPLEKFSVIPLSIPLLSPECQSSVDDKKNNKFTCLFVGSLVPLHGVSKILAAAKKLAPISDIEFVIIGDGQESEKISIFLEDSCSANVTWHRGMFDTAFITQAIMGADLCLGIFGDSQKAHRVLPYKIYYYCALGKPFITEKSPSLTNFCGSYNDIFLCASGDEGVDSLVEMITAFYEERSLLLLAANASRVLYKTKLSREVLTNKMHELFGLSAI